MIANMRKIVNQQREIAIKVNVSKKPVVTQNADLEHLESHSPSTTGILKKN